jgi:hypothetical protein
VRFLLWLASVGAVVWGAWPQPAAPMLVVGGDALGYLSPCGCTKPMSGGVRRKVTAVRRLRLAGEVVWVENGGLVQGTSRQDEMKAETLAEAMASGGLAALAYGRKEAALGPGMTAALARLSGGVLVSGSVRDPEVATFLAAGPFLVGAASADPEALAARIGAEAVPTASAVSDLLARAEGVQAVLLWDGDLASARALAGRHPGLAAIVYSSSGRPPETAERVGETWLLSPGDRGRWLVVTDLRGSYRVVELGPEYADDPEAGRAYRRYLERVGDEGLLDMVPRASGPGFAGSQACAPCHTGEHEVWAASAHGSALATLEREGHDRDPDCVGCHVVGLDSVKGFRSREKTPSLADVGCESCHGPGATHAMKPAENPMPKVGERSCAPCHNPDHSPGFDFDSYWEKIAHGPGSNVENLGAKGRKLVR